DADAGGSPRRPLALHSSVPGGLNQVHQHGSTLALQHHGIHVQSAPGVRSRSSAARPECTTSGAVAGSVGTSHRNSAVAAAAPRNWAAMKPGTSAGRMPANVSLAARASVTAGLANEVDAVNQY